MSLQRNEIVLDIESIHNFFIPNRNNISWENSKLIHLVQIRSKFVYPFTYLKPLTSHNMPVNILKYIQV